MILTYAVLHTAKRERRLSDLLTTSALRIDAAHICAANDRLERSASWWLDTLKAYMELERQQTRAAIAAQAERDALLEVLDELIVETDAEAYVRARQDVLAGTTWTIEAGAVTVQRPGRDAHRVTRAGCDCPARVLCRHQALRYALARLHRRRERMAA